MRSGSGPLWRAGSISGFGITPTSEHSFCATCLNDGLASRCTGGTPGIPGVAGCTPCVGGDNSLGNKGAPEFLGGTSQFI